MVYPIFLVVISLVVLTAEIVRPMRPEQPMFRKNLGSDVAHLVFNGHFLGAGLYAFAAAVLWEPFQTALRSLGLESVLFAGIAAKWPVLVQIVVALVVVDLMQWSIHVLLHRVPLLWRFHRVHHSVPLEEMDFWVAFRFHWMEVVLYKTLQYVPLALLGFGWTAVMVHAVFGTLIGHLNHANIDLHYGRLGYVLNSPRMHLWHHDRAGPTRGRNFAIIFSAWDWMFGTAEWPEHPPDALGFNGDEAVPDGFFGQEGSGFGSGRWATVLGVSVVSSLVWWTLR